MLEKIDIPILEKDEKNNKYWVIYKNNKYLKEDMSNPILQSFQEKKKAESPFISLTQDGEKITGIVEEIKQLSKIGFKGQEMEVIRLVLETQNGVKNFDRGTKAWVDELMAKGVDVGSNITIVRRGDKGSKDTSYEVIVNG